MAVTKHIPLADGGWDYVSIDPCLAPAVRSGGATERPRSTSVAGTVREQLVDGDPRPCRPLRSATTGMAALTSTAAGGVLLFDANTGAVAATVKTGPKPDAAIWDGAAKLSVRHGQCRRRHRRRRSGQRAASSRNDRDSRRARIGRARWPRPPVRQRGGSSGELVTVDLASRRVIRTTKLGCEEPNGLALTTAGTLIAACASKAGQVRRGKHRRRSSVRTGDRAALGHRPLRCRAQSRLYSDSGRRHDDRTRYREETAGRRLRAVATGPGARSAAWSIRPPARSTSSRRNTRPRLVAERPKALPGSVEILEVR